MKNVIIILAVCQFFIVTLKGQSRADLEDRRKKTGGRNQKVMNDGRGTRDDARWIRRERRYKMT